MVFSTILFLCIFLPVTIIIYYILPGKLRNAFLLIASLIFYAWGEPKYLLCMLLAILQNYVGGLLVAGDRKKKICLVLVVILNILMLAFFKYTDFVVGNIRNVFPDALAFVPSVVMPIGISFYTFQGLSYTIDVYRDRSLVQKNPFKLALYISMFPQLIAGPIVRYTDVKDRIDERSLSAAVFASGAERFIIGLFKKSVIANGVGALADQIMGGDFSYMSVSVAWLGAIAYTLQIYYDFSGYSDMAIGIGRILGFEFPENFKDPYISKSVSEFWRRWHISLSSWFRDYVYIPLGGSRKGNVYLNLLIVFVLTGIWHGAGWGFLFWGLWHGFFVVAERLVRNLISGTSADGKSTAAVSLNGRKEPSAASSIARGVISRVYTLLVVIVGWVLFRLVSVKKTLTYLSVMFGVKENSFTAFDLKYYLSGERMVILVIALIGATGVITLIKGKSAKEKAKPDNDKEEIFGKAEAGRKAEAGGKAEAGDRSIVGIIAYRILLMILLAISYISIITGSYNPFIYFRF